MKFVKKGQPPQFLKDYLAGQEQAGLEVTYENFNATGELRKVLLEEQGYLLTLRKMVKN